MDKARIAKAFGKVLSLVSIGFIIFSIFKLGLDFSFVNNLPLFITVVICGVIIKLLSLWLSATSWTTWLAFLSKQTFNKNSARNVFIRANIGKYVPGNVMHFVQRNLFASDMGIGQMQLAMASIIEIASYVFVAFAIALITESNELAAVFQSYFFTRMPVLCFFVICGFILFIGLIVFFRKKITFFLANYKFHDFVKTLVIVMLLQIFILTMLGFVLVLLVLYAQGKTSLHIIETVLSTYILSWVLGYIVPGASGGIGIREMSLLLLLGPILGNSLVLSLSIVHRLITIVGDFLGYLIASIQYKRNIGNFSNV